MDKDVRRAAEDSISSLFGDGVVAVASSAARVWRQKLLDVANNDTIVTLWWNKRC